MTRRLVLFCDFDGTITEKDNIVAIMRQFAPEGWEELTRQILAQEISIQEGVGQLFAMLPSSLREEITRFITAEAKIRPGFPEFVQFCKEREIELLITSGGIDFFVYPILEPFGLTGPIYCNGSDFSGDTIRITWPHSCDDHCSNGACGMCKTTIIRRYDPAETFRVVIGDSITDLAGANIADFVIARSLLLDTCKELNLPHQPFATFHDVIDILQTLEAQLEVEVS